jgi:hypothetical protein
MGAGRRGQGDKGTRGQGDKGKRGQGDKGTRGRGDKGKRGRGEADCQFENIKNLIMAFGEFCVADKVL